MGNRSRHVLVDAFTRRRSSRSTGSVASRSLIGLATSRNLLAYRRTETNCETEDELNWQLRSERIGIVLAMRRPDKCATSFDRDALGHIYCCQWAAKTIGNTFGHRACVPPSFPIERFRIGIAAMESAGWQ